MLIHIFPIQIAFIYFFIPTRGEGWCLTASLAQWTEFHVVSEGDM